MEGPVSEHGDKAVHIGNVAVVRSMLEAGAQPDKDGEFNRSSIPLRNDQKWR